MKKNLKRLLALTLAVILLSCFQVQAFAAGVSISGKSVKGDNDHAAVISVITNKKTTLKFTQTKGRITYQNMATWWNHTDTYGDYFIYVTDASGVEKPKSYDCSLKKSITITLSANKNYTITICPYEKSRTFYHLKNAGKLSWKAPWENSFTWDVKPTWTATASKAAAIRLLKISSV